MKIVKKDSGDDPPASHGTENKRRRYQEYSLLYVGHDGQLIEDRSVRIYRVEAPPNTPFFGLPPNTTLTAHEEMELRHSSMYLLPL